MSRSCCAPLSIPTYSAPFPYWNALLIRLRNAQNPVIENTKVWWHTLLFLKPCPHPDPGGECRSSLITRHVMNATASWEGTANSGYLGSRERVSRKNNARI